VTEPLYRRSYESQEIALRFPPRWGHPNKEIVYQVAFAAGLAPEGQITVSRWPAMPLPAKVEITAASTAFECREDVFQYEPTPDGADSVEWYLNFANFDLFSAYGTPLLAQDELQVAEHPALASLRETMRHDGLSTLTVEDGEPTPILVMGAERRCVIHTDRNPAEGRPHGLYGNAFSAADGDAVRRATKPIVPSTRSNIIAMEAPSYGMGSYTIEQIEYIVRTAFTGFSAARLETESLGDGSMTAVVHTGFWGGGAYGGNRLLMSMLQFLAASLAGVGRLLFHTVDSSGTAVFEEAMDVYRQDVPSDGAPRTCREVLEAIASREFQWGESDGN
jgi:hypothetical protein